ncbi:hypothetical protein LOAG_14079 [Loa loa]|uniref:Uncharacterized protein n=1 Tax=Loa loa TaxID=7209 RepID=A0A1S0TID9_LOALO|nr:hypothetical protein LOAG_14079 [Loa loa]EFO14441.1 hypothetical protein LOAG_14079 [Loa loa]
MPLCSTPSYRCNVVEHPSNLSVPATREREEESTIYILNILRLCTRQKKATFIITSTFCIPKQKRRRRPNEDAHPATSSPRYHLLSLCYQLFIIILPIVNITNTDTVNFLRTC